MESIQKTSSPTSPTPSAPLPSSTPIAEIAKRCIPIDAQSIPNFSDATNLTNLGNIVVSEDGNTLLAIEVENKQEEAQAFFFGLTTFLKQAPNRKEVNFTIRSSEEAVLYYRAGILPQSVEKPSVAERMSSGIPPRIQQQLKALSYPQPGKWADEVVPQLLNESLEKPGFLSNLAQQAYSELSLDQTTAPATALDPELERKILSKETRKFQIKSGDHSAIMITKVYKKGEKLIFQFVDLQINDISVIDSTTLSPMDKFNLYRLAVLRYMQYRERFPLAKGPGETKQQYTKNIPFKAIVETSSRKLVDLLWRLGCAPVGKVEEIYKAYLEAIFTMSPKKHEFSKKMQEMQKATPPNNFSQEVAEKLESEITKIFGKEGFEEFSEIQSVEPEKQQQEFLRFLAKQCPIAVDNDCITTLNKEIKRLIDQCPLSSFTLEFFPIDPWLLISPEADQMPPEALEAFKMLERSYELDCNLSKQEADTLD